MNRLRELREEKKLSLRDMAERVGMSASVLGNYERGDREPKIATWKELADFFNVSTAYIMGLSDERTEDTKIILKEIQSTLEENLSNQEFPTNENVENFKKSFDSFKTFLERFQCEQEKTFIEAFRKLNDAGREELFKYADYLYSQEKYRTEKVKMFINGKEVSPASSDISKK